MSDPLPWRDGHGRRYALPYQSDHCPLCTTTYAPRSGQDAISDLPDGDDGRPSELPDPPAPGADDR